METLRQDLRYAARSLRRSPGFTLVCILMLALGIGSATAIFSIVQGVLLRPLEYPEADRIVRLWQIGDDGGRMNFAGPNFADVREQSRSFQSLAQVGSGGTISVVGGSEAARARAVPVSREFFTVLGVQPSVGRSFMEDEESGAGASSVVVSHEFWQTALGGTADVIGRSLRVDERTATIVGVMPAGFDFPGGTQLWLPRQAQPSEESRTAHNWSVYGRLADGVTLEQAEQELSTIAARLKAQHGDDTWMADAGVIPLHEQIVGSARPALIVLAGAAGLLLLIAGANVLNLMLARVAARAREMAVRQALGAGRWRIAQQFLSESLLLALIGGVLGIGIAALGLKLLLAYEPGNLPRVEEIGVDLPALGFALAASLALAAVLGITAAIRGGAENVRSALSEDPRTQAAGRSSQRLRGALVVSQVALTFILLVGTGLIARSLISLLSVDPGYRVEDAVVVDLSFPIPADIPEAIRSAEVRSTLLDRPSDIPGVDAVGSINALPLSGSGTNGTFLIQQHPDEVESYEAWDRLMSQPGRSGHAAYRIASEDYFHAMEIPLIRGRLFERSDDLEAPNVALISEGLAESQWPDEDPIGKLIQFGNMDGDLRPMRVVGIVGDVRHHGLDDAPEPTIYGSARQRVGAGSSFSAVLATTSDPAMVITAARQTVREIAPEVPPQIRTLEEIFAGTLAYRRFTLFVLGAFGASALLLAVLGIYGVVSYAVEQRTREMGIRIALGAHASDVTRLVVSGGLRLTGAGLAVGVLGAWAATRLLASQLFGVDPLDATTFLAGCLLLAFAAALASYIPARRATRVDPMIALRAE